MSGPFGGFIFWRIFDFRKIESAISDITLSVLCRQVLHSDLQVKHGDFLLSGQHCSWGVCGYKSALLLFYYSKTEQNKF